MLNKISFTVMTAYMTLMRRFMLNKIKFYRYDCIHYPYEKMHA